MFVKYFTKPQSKSSLTPTYAGHAVATVKNATSRTENSPIILPLNINNKKTKLIEMRKRSVYRRYAECEVNISSECSQTKGLRSKHSLERFPYIGTNILIFRFIFQHCLRSTLAFIKKKAKNKTTRLGRKKNILGDLRFVCSKRVFLKECTISHSSVEAFWGLFNILSIYRASEAGTGDRMTR